MKNSSLIIAVALTANGCTVVSVAGTAVSKTVSIAATVVETGVSVAGSAAKGVANAISSPSDKK